MKNTELAIRPNIGYGSHWVWLRINIIVLASSRDEADKAMCRLADASGWVWDSGREGDEPSFHSQGGGDETSKSFEIALPFCWKKTINIPRELSKISKVAESLGIQTRWDKPKKAAVPSLTFVSLSSQRTEDSTEIHANLKDARQASREEDAWMLGQVLSKKSSPGW
ncbi:hypothetical protein EPO05_02430 [Patescibacteria group bacterium]|nr:MAG: hypothetical protein EPO05_02430 [Patescibacteria group bacterium]